MTALLSQVLLAPRSTKSMIAEALVSRLSLVRQLRYVSFDRIKLLVDDFHPHEIPACQVYDVSLEHLHENGRGRNTWRLAIEILMRGDENRTVSQSDLWDLEYQVKRVLMAQPKLGIKNVIQLELLGTATDLHLLEPFYFSRMDWQVLFYEDVVRPC